MNAEGQTYINREELDARDSETPLTFEFGKNWQSFLEQIDQQRISWASASLRQWLRRDRFEGTSFLDIGCGSGLFSLSAALMGARVYSLDVDPLSVECARVLKQKYMPNYQDWTINSGSALDLNFMQSLGRFDVVYSWGVLHHTGKMWDALTNCFERVKPDGYLFIAIYNDQGETSQRWCKVKKFYNSLPSILRPAMLSLAFVLVWGKCFLGDCLRLRPLGTWRRWKDYSKTGRGMSPWRDLVDWIGGYPFEVAKPEEILDFCLKEGFTLEKLRTNGGGLACNEYLFHKTANTR